MKEKIFYLVGRKPDGFEKCMRINAKDIEQAIEILEEKHGLYYLYCKLVLEKVS